ncbi:endonuclease/exonuclease/phosphatase family protein [Mesonia sp. MT50]|uniref:Endonuclease/exonuclease/phosphatase family protein n=1 Tax=Mesonia profundi TaxID=3070998 RepID=A0ABU1A1N7_9FLAO|nr:endonuclease/exonuclease/phosphatase family protein [Mesonia profundi]MDQ7917617.1 endonuclease/exonuclease/phosphatase family protein [Mesonia profundi]
MNSKSRSLLKALFKIMALVLLALSFVPYFLYQIWWIDIFSNFQVQYLVLMLLLLLIFAVQKNMKWILFLSVGIIFSAYQIYPFYVNASAEAKHETEELISIASINVLSSNKDVAAVAEFIKEKNPDILMLVELTPRWDQDLVEVLRTYDYQLKEVREDNFGIGVWSKIPVELDILYFSKYQLPSILLSYKAEGTSLSLIATHPFPPVGQQQFEQRNRQLQKIAAFLTTEKPQNAVVIGDLNTSSFSRNFKNFK